MDKLEYKKNADLYLIEKNLRDFVEINGKDNFFMMCVFKEIAAIYDTYLIDNPEFASFSVEQPKIRNFYAKLNKPQRGGQIRN